MSLDSKYDSQSKYRRGITEPHGRIMLSGQQALVRLLLARSAADRAAGLHTAGFVSGYRGSPLGGLDQELVRAKELLERENIRFLPAINEDLAATALIGSQRVESDAKKRFDGVFGMWYGKGPGVDRSGDAIKHGNYYGSSPKGGVLVITGDDHGCVSSSMSHQSDRALIAWGLPVIHPSGLADYERCGLWGWALSRVSGLWVGFKAITETVEASASIQSAPFRQFTVPAVDPGPDGLHWRWPDLPGMQIERRLPFKLAAVRSFIEANPIDEAVTAPARPELVIGAVGKAYRDVRAVLQSGGISLEQLERAGIALLKIHLVSPLSPLLETWAKRADQVLIVEEKQPIVEELLKQALYNAETGQRARICGKADEQRRPLLSSYEELRPSRIAPALAVLLAKQGLRLQLPEQADEVPLLRGEGWVKRTPYFCSGCPHNTSTCIPDGSEARLGIGCHAMAARMPERGTSGSVQMGGEGVDWLGQAPFVETAHIFQNIGDGTFFHSGFLAIRQAIAAGATITYKLLYNDAVAMTGGQPIDGRLTVQKAAALVKSEGASRVVVVADDPTRYRLPGGLPAGVELHHRDQLEKVQLQLRSAAGVSVLIFDQVCATEERRRKKRLPAAKKKTEVLINEMVCDGCGDCQKQSNCLSIVPVDTAFGRKRQIDPHSCNTDLSCVKGFCPSFVTVTGTPRKRAKPQLAAEQVLARAEALSRPALPAIQGKPFELMFVGVGGTGVVTAASALAMGAHLEGRCASVLDFTGFAQKGGSVLSHIRIAPDSETLHQYRIDRHCADVMLAADLVVATEDDALAALQRDKTIVVANTAETQTGAMLRDASLRIETSAIEALLKKQVGTGRYHALDARQLASALIDPMQANLLLLGFAWQIGAIPISLPALRQAFSLQGGAAGKLLAFAWGRLWAAQPQFVAQWLQDWEPGSSGEVEADTLEQIVARRSRYLTDYQNAGYTARYLHVIEQVRAASAAIGDERLAEAVARNLFRLMAYKDEYEVARLLTSPAFMQQVRSRFEGPVRLKFHLSPPFVRKLRMAGAQEKTALSGWIMPVLKLVSKGKVLRGTPFDIFGKTAERKEERRLLREYEQTLLDLLPLLTVQKLPLFIAWVNAPDAVRGYGNVKAQPLAIARNTMQEIRKRIEEKAISIQLPANPDFGNHKDGPQEAEEKWLSKII